MLPKKRPPTSPGEMLLNEFIKPFGMTQKEFAHHVDWTYTRLNEIVRGKRGITASSALTLADAFKMEPDFWLNLQKNWDLWNALQHHKPIKPMVRKAAA